MSTSHRVLDLAHRDTQELTGLWLLHSPDMESGRGRREGREERGKKGLIVRERRVGNFTGRPEQSLEETQALSTALSTPWVIYGLESTLEKQTLLSLTRCAPSADIQPPLATVPPPAPQGCPASLGAGGGVPITKGEQQPAPCSPPSPPPPLALPPLLLPIYLPNLATTLPQQGPALRLRTALGLGKGRSTTARGGGNRRDLNLGGFMAGESGF